MILDLRQKYMNINPILIKKILIKLTEQVILSKYFIDFSISLVFVKIKLASRITNELISDMTI
jgi:hypothetical protein